MTGRPSHWQSGPACRVRSPRRHSLRSPSATRSAVGLVSAANRKQAWLPRGAVVLENRWGSAPAFALTHEGTTVVCLPGVPLEMRNIFESAVAPMWHAASPTVVHKVRELRCG